MAIVVGAFFFLGDHNKKPTAKSVPDVGPDEDLVTVVVPEGAGPGDQIEVVNPVTTSYKYNVTVPAGLTAGSSFDAVVPRKYGTITMVVPEGEGPGAVR